MGFLSFEAQTEEFLLLLVLRLKPTNPWPKAPDLTILILKHAKYLPTAPRRSPQSFLVP
jgi:hypothetical protein